MATETQQRSRVPRMRVGGRGPAIGQQLAPRSTIEEEIAEYRRRAVEAQTQQLANVIRSRVEAQTQQLANVIRSRVRIDGRERVIRQELAMEIAESMRRVDEEEEAQTITTTTTSNTPRVINKTLLGPAVFLDSGEVCAICLNNMKEDEEARTLGCNHSFHIDCISKWVERQTTCPLCRFDMCSRKRQRT
ncbi:hypothetical protein FRX31_026676 [Thalictrum thalictroides]|uniref:RING-type E3 ubiquitin transferase n=1 Tax=Thalictrum thalictroides TaxID=46969 RepID=A0A7J6VF41_THATH|nr:hypothetical protein FRX31_026676 [Thalictrum thalictroides]